MKNQRIKKKIKKTNKMRISKIKSKKLKSKNKRKIILILKKKIIKKIKALKKK